MGRLDEETSLYTVVVNSCDKYSESWVPFFTLLHRYWPDLGSRVVLNTEFKSYDHDGIDLTVVRTGADAWTNRLLHVLESISTPFVILLLDDYFLQGPVNAKVLGRALDAMIGDETIAVMYFKQITGRDLALSEHPGFRRIDPAGKYAVSFQAGLWRRQALIEVMPRDASPWEVETRVRPSGDVWKFFCVTQSEWPDGSGEVFPYEFMARRGYGISQASWLWNNARLFQREGIECAMVTLPRARRLPFWFRHYRVAIASRGRSLLARFGSRKALSDIIERDGL